MTRKMRMGKGVMATEMEGEGVLLFARYILLYEWLCYPPG